MILQLPAAVAAESDNGPFALIQGIPVHPLVVHAAVVFIPLAAIGLILMAVLPKFGARYGWIVWGLGLIALGSALVAKESGEALEGLVGEPGYDHGEWGDRMPLFAAALFLVALVLWFAQRSYVKREDGGKALVVILGILAAIVAVANIFWVVQTGHTGAESVWSGEVDSSAATTTGTPQAESGEAEEQAAPSESASTGPAADNGVYTAAAVAKHDTPADCWTSINGNVYDVTSWIDRHPGGAQRIINLCGIDGSSAFDGQHSGQARPEKELAGFQVGTLG